MKVSLQTFGTRGDVYPFVALGAGLRARGHDVDLATSVDFKAMVEEAGLNFREIPGSGAHYFATPAVVKAIRKSPSSIRTAMAMPRPSVDEVADSLERMYDNAQGADFMLSNLITRGIGYAGPGVPWGTVSWWPMTPTREFRAYKTPDLPLGSAYTRLTHGMAAQMEWAFNRPAVNRFRTRRGLPKLSKSPVGQLGHQQPVFYPYSPHFLPPPSDWPERVHVTGYWSWERPEQQHQADLVDFLAAGSKPIVLALGSAWPVYGEQTLDLVRQAVRQARRRLIVVGGPEGDRPDDELRVQEVDYGWLFPQVAAVIHGATFGTTADVLRSGVPQVTVPCWADGPYWAARLAQVGVAPAPIPFQKLTGAQLRAALDEVVTDPGYAERAAELGARVRADRGVEKACDLIETWVSNTTA
ncbi:glycosyltransferase [Streptomyces sp. NPDC041068]|uniref:glycosyltransferase n=1 Tax=Streptomyces sp. NPDC041068 TaxID=3155130 RepID=UPI0033E8E3F1